MLLLSLAARSLRNRLLVTCLTITSIGLSVALLLGVESLRVGVRESFANTIYGTDLIVGARGGGTQLLLSTVFDLGVPPGAMTYESFERIRDHAAVGWAIPFSLGDSHRGFRVVGTNEDFYTHWQYGRGNALAFSEGRQPAADDEVAIGQEVARTLGYGIGSEVAVTHGLSSAAGGILNHDDAPFRVVGILERTSTPVDRSLYVTLAGIEAMHEGFEATATPVPLGAGRAAAPAAAEDHDHEEESAADDHDHDHDEVAAADPASGSGGGTAEVHDHDHVHDTDKLTAVIVGTRNRVETLLLQQEINTDPEEPLSAIVPGVELAQLWRSFGYFETGLKAVATFVLLVGLTGTLLSVYTSLNERRREMAILRAIGAGPRQIFTLLLVESGLLALLGSAAGVGLVYALLAGLQPFLEQRFGLYLTIRPLGSTESMYLALIVLGGFVIGLVPAIKAYRNALADGLAVKI